MFGWWWGVGGLVGYQYPPGCFGEERQGGLDTPPGASFGERMRDRHACETETLCASQTHNQSSRPRKRQICGTETRLCQPNNSGVCSGLIHGAHVCLYTYPPENSPICSAPTRPRACCAGPPAKACCCRVPCANSSSSSRLPMVHRNHASCGVPEHNERRWYRCATRYMHYALVRLSPPAPSSAGRL